eukprot:240442-Rhodomonas_salina.3
MLLLRTSPGQAREESEQRRERLSLSQICTLAKCNLSHTATVTLLADTCTRVPGYLGYPGYPVPAQAYRGSSSAVPGKLEYSRKSKSKSSRDVRLGGCPLSEISQFLTWQRHVDLSMHNNDCSVVPAGEGHGYTWYRIGTSHPGPACCTTKTRQPRARRLSDASSASLFAAQYNLLVIFSAVRARGRNSYVDSESDASLVLLVVVLVVLLVPVVAMEVRRRTSSKLDLPLTPGTRVPYAPYSP